MEHEHDAGIIQRERGERTDLGYFDLAGSGSTRQLPRLLVPPVRPRWNSDVSQDSVPSPASSDFHSFDRRLPSEDYLIENDHTFGENQAPWAQAMRGSQRASELSTVVPLTPTTLASYVTAAGGSQVASDVARPFPPRSSSLPLATSDPVYPLTPPQEASPSPSQPEQRGSSSSSTSPSSRKVVPAFMLAADRNELRGQFMPLGDQTFSTLVSHEEPLPSLSSSSSSFSSPVNALDSRDTFPFSYMASSSSGTLSEDGMSRRRRRGSLASLSSSAAQIDALENVARCLMVPQSPQIERDDDNEERVVLATHTTLQPTPSLVRRLFSGSMRRNEGRRHPEVVELLEELDESSLSPAQVHVDIVVDEVAEPNTARRTSLLPRINRLSTMSIGSLMRRVDHKLDPSDTPPTPSTPSAPTHERVRLPPTRPPPPPPVQQQQEPLTPTRPGPPAEAHTPVATVTAMVSAQEQQRKPTLRARPPAVRADTSGAVPCCTPPTSSLPRTTSLSASLPRTGSSKRHKPDVRSITRKLSFRTDTDKRKRQRREASSQADPMEPDMSIDELYMPPAQVTGVSSLVELLPFDRRDDKCRETREARREKKRAQRALLELWLGRLALAEVAEVEQHPRAVSEGDDGAIVPTVLLRQPILHAQRQPEVPVHHVAQPRGVILHQRTLEDHVDFPSTPSLDTVASSAPKRASAIEASPRRPRKSTPSFPSSLRVRPAHLSLPPPTPPPIGPLPALPMPVPALPSTPVVQAVDLPPRSQACSFDSLPDPMRPCVEDDAHSGDFEGSEGSQDDDHTHESLMSVAISGVNISPAAKLRSQSVDDLSAATQGVAKRGVNRLAHPSKAQTWYDESDSSVGHARVGIRRSGSLVRVIPTPRRLRTSGGDHAPALPSSFDALASARRASGWTVDSRLLSDALE